MLLFNLLEDPIMYRSVSQSDGHARVWVKASSAHLKGASIFLIYDCPKRLSFIAEMGLKVHTHFLIVLIRTLRSVFVSLFPPTIYLSLSCMSIVLLVTCLLRDKV